MKFRLATHDDLEAMTSIYNEAVASGRVNDEERPLTVSEREDWFHEHEVDERFGLWVVVSDSNQVIGYTSLNHFGNHKAYDSAAKISYYLTERVHGKGVGSQTLSFLVKTAQQKRFRYLMASVLPINQASEGLLKKFGFVKWGESPDVVALPKITTSVCYYAKFISQIDFPKK